MSKSSSQSRLTAQMLLVQLQVTSGTAPPGRLASRQPFSTSRTDIATGDMEEQALAAQQHRLYDAGDTPVELRPGKAADAVSKISLARSQEAQ